MSQRTRSTVLVMLVGFLATLLAGFAHAESEIEKVSVSRPWRIAFVSKDQRLANEGATSPYWARAWEGAHQAFEGSDVTVELHTIRNRCLPVSTCIEPQIKLVLDIINQGQTDGIVIGPMNSARLVPVVEKAIAAGIPVVAMDTPLNSEKILSFVVFDNFEAGKALGAWVAEQIGDNGRVAILKGPEDQRNAIDRHKGFLAGLATRDIQVVHSAAADWEITIARELMIEWLASSPDIEAVIAANDLMALGAVEVLEEAGRKDVIVAGYDGIEPALQAIADGRMTATIDQAPDIQAQLAVQMLLRHLEHQETFEPIVLLPAVEIITQENVRKYLQAH